MNLTQAIRLFNPDTIQLLSTTYESQKAFFMVSNELPNKFAAPGLYQRETIEAELKI